nr:hypothetical protein [Tanacetum cinerariifolium]
MDKIICDLNKTPDLFQEPPPQNCPKCGNPVDGAHYGYNCSSKVPIIPNLGPCNNQTIDELPQTLPSFDPTCSSEDGISFTYDFISNIVDDSPNVFNPPLQPPTYSYEFYGNDAYYGHDCPLQVPFTYDPEPCYNQDFNFPKNFQIFQKQYLCCTRCEGPHETCQCDQLIFDEPYCENYGGLHMSFHCQPMNQNHYEPNSCYDSNFFGFDQFQPPQFPVIHQPIREKTCAKLLAEEHEANIMYINTPSWDHPTICYNDDDDDEDCTIAITPILSTEEPDNSLKISSGSTTTHSDISLPDYEAFYDDHVKEISSGSTTTHSDISLPDYEAFYDDHVKEISSGSTTTHSDCSLYDSLIFDLSINSFPPTDRSDFYHEEFVNELAHIISPPEYDCFYFKNKPNSGDFTMDVVEDTFPTREPRIHVHNVLTTHHTLHLNLDFILSIESLFAYVVWIFLLFLSYSVAPQYLLFFGNKDTIFDLGISSYQISSFMPDVSHQSRTFINFNVYPKHLNGSPMKILFSTCYPIDQ